MRTIRAGLLALLVTATGGSTQSTLGPWRIVHDGDTSIVSSASDGRLVGALTSEWSAEPYDDVRARENGHWYGVRRFPLAGGTLRVHLPLAERAIARGVRLDVRTDGRRALLHYDASPHGRGLLLDPDAPLPLASWKCYGRDAVFTEGGATVVALQGSELLRVDAERGSVEPALGLLGLDDVPWRDLPFAVTTDAVLVATVERVRTFGLRSLVQTDEVFLKPPLSTSRPAPHNSPTLVADPHARVLVFEVEGEIVAYDMDRGARLWARPLARIAGPAQVDAGALLVRDADGTLVRLAVRSGEPVNSTRDGTFDVSAVEAFSVRDVDTDVRRDGALVRTENGEFRTFSSRDGATLGRTELHVGRESVDVALAADGSGADFVSWDQDGRVALLRLPALDERARLELRPDVRVVAADALHGLVVVARRIELGDVTEVALRRIVDGEALATFELAEFLRAAPSADGARVALVAS